MLAGGARWAVGRGWGCQEDLDRVEEHGCMQGARPECVSAQARKRQRNEMGTLGSGNHYLGMGRDIGIQSTKPQSGSTTMRSGSKSQRSETACDSPAASVTVVRASR